VKGYKNCIAGSFEIEYGFYEFDAFDQIVWKEMMEWVYKPWSRKL